MLQISSDMFTFKLNKLDRKEKDLKAKAEGMKEPKLSI